MSDRSYLEVWCGKDDVEKIQTIHDVQPEFEDDKPDENGIYRLFDPETSFPYEETLKELADAGVSCWMLHGACPGAYEPMLYATHGGDHTCCDANDAGTPIVRLDEEGVPLGWDLEAGRKFLHMRREIIAKIKAGKG